MKRKITSFALTICLMFVILVTSTGCSSEDITIPTDYNLTTTEVLPNQTKQHRITIINDSEYGTIYPNLNNETSSVFVNDGDSYTISVKAKEGYNLDKLLVDGEEVVAQEIYTFKNINKSFSISATYTKTAENAPQFKTLDLIGMRFRLNDPSADEIFNNNSVYLSIIYSTKLGMESGMSDFIDGSVDLINETDVRFNASGVSDGKGGYIWERYHKCNSENLITIDENNCVQIGIGAKKERVGSHYSLETFSVSDMEFVGNSYYNVYMIELDGVFGLEYMDGAFDTSADDQEITGVKLYFIAQ